MAPIDILLRKLKYHSPIDPADVAALRRLRCEIRELASGEEFIRQGDRPKAAAIVTEGVLARYHTLQAGARQYLALHYPGDWPDCPVALSSADGPFSLRHGPRRRLLDFSRAADEDFC